jgi:hypothetical protein
MPNLDQDRQFLDAGMQVLSDYLLSKELFYPLGGDLPRLTLGNLLLAQRRLTTAGSELHNNEIAAVREKWQVAWGQKAFREVYTRLELWCNFLSEYRSSAAAHADRFSVEVRHRAILQLLSQYVTSAAELDQLPGLDSLLKGSFSPGEFVWEKQVSKGFDPIEFWFLYGKLKSK